MTEPYADLGGRPSTATPPPAPLRSCGQHPCLGHPDGHCCPWVDTDDGITPCLCTHQPAEKGTKR